MTVREAISCSNEEMGWRIDEIAEHPGKHLFSVASPMKGVTQPMG
jgi:hypothetical protein